MKNLTLKSSKIVASAIFCAMMTANAHAHTCPLTIKVSNIRSDDSGISEEDAAALTGYLVTAMSDKNYNVIPTREMQDGDVDASSVVSYGTEPRFPVIKSCSADFRILKTERVGYGSKSLYQDDVDAQGPLMTKKKCLKKIRAMLDAIPDCADL